MPVPTESPRERQRLDTKRRLLEAAERLVAAQGYSGTTVAQIAQAAGVTERTFFRHFKNKSDLFLTNWKEIAKSMDAAMRELPATTSAFDVAVAGLRAFADGAQLVIDREAPASMATFADTAPVLGMLQTVLALESELSSTLAWRLGRDPEDADVRLTANATIGVLRATIRSYSIGRRGRTLPDAVAANMEWIRPVYDSLSTGQSSSAGLGSRG
jgi:AcrR family transcriptional regulator